MDILDSMTPDQLRAKCLSLQSAIARAHYCLVDGRRVGDAIKVLKIAAPRECEETASNGGEFPDTGRPLL